MRRRTGRDSFNRLFYQSTERDLVSSPGCGWRFPFPHWCALRAAFVFKCVSRIPHRRRRATRLFMGTGHPSNVDPWQLGRYTHIHTYREVRPDVEAGADRKVWVITLFRRDTAGLARALHGVKVECISLLMVKIGPCVEARSMGRLYVCDWVYRRAESGLPGERECVWCMYDQERCDVVCPLSLFGPGHAPCACGHPATTAVWWCVSNSYYYCACGRLETRACSLESADGDRTRPYLARPVCSSMAETGPLKLRTSAESLLLFLMILTQLTSHTKIIQKYFSIVQTKQDEKQFIWNTEEKFIRKSISVQGEKLREVSAVFGTLFWRGHYTHCKTHQCRVSMYIFLPF